MEGALWLIAAIVLVAAAVVMLTWWAGRRERQTAQRWAERVRATEEKAHQAEKDEERAKAVFAAAEQGRFIPLPPGSVSFGAEEGEEAYHTCPAEYAATHEAGHIYISNRRVLFLAKGKKVSMGLTDVDRVDHPFENAFRLIDEKNNRTEVFFTQRPREAAAHILVLKQRGARRAD